MDIEIFYDGVLSLLECGSLECLDKAFKMFLSHARGKDIYKQFLLPLNIDYNTFKNDRLAGLDTKGKINGIVQRFADVLDKYKKESDSSNDYSIDKRLNRLYSLNFTHQTEYFKHSCCRKGVILFTLRESNSFTLQWVLNKLIIDYRELGASLQNPIVNIDASLGNCQAILDSMFLSKATNTKKATKNIINQLNNSSLIYVVSNAYNFIHSDYFQDFLDFLQDTHEYTIDEENRCIFIFLENDVNNAYNSVDVILSKEVSISDLPNIIQQKQDIIHFIDLTNSTKITKDCLNDWRAKNLNNHVLTPEIAEDILSNCDGYPEKVIPRIAELIGIENFKELCIKNNISYNG